MNKKVEKALNEQVNMELGAYYTYLSMSSHFQSTGFPGFAAWMGHHASEEMVHAMKIYDYIHRRNGNVKLMKIDAPQHSWDSPLAAFEDAYKHERKVSTSIDNLVKLAREENDNATESFLQWFVDEQVEEEEIVSNAIDQLKLIGDFGPGLFLLDRELGAGASAGAGSEADAT